MDTTRKLWLGLTALLLAGFGVLLWMGGEIHQQAPPMPAKVVTTDGSVVFTRADIEEGRQVWQSTGGQQLGSIWGHGALVAPDWSADWLHREATTLLELRSRSKLALPYSLLAPSVQAQIQADQAKMQADQQYQVAEFQHKQQMAAMDAQTTKELSAQKLANEREIAVLKIQAESQAAAERTTAEMALARWKAEQELTLAREQNVLNLASRHEIAKTAPKLNGGGVRMGGKIG